MTIIQTDNFGYNDIFRSKLHENSYNYPMHMHQHVEAVIVLDGELEITTDCGTELA